MSEFAKVVPKDALDYIASKKIKASFDWHEVYAQEHVHAFTVAKIMEADVLEQLHKSVIKAVEDGKTFESFKKDLLKNLGESGWGKFQMRDEKTGELLTRLSDRRLKKIYHVNTRQSYLAGAWQRIEKTKKALPYLQYRLGPSVNHREAHVAFANKVLPVDDPFWNMHYPMNGWGCKCWVKQLTKSQAEEIGVSESPKIEYQDWVNPSTGEVKKVPRSISPGFEYNVGKQRFEADTLMVSNKISQHKDWSPAHAKKLLNLLSESEINSVQSLHFQKGYEVLEKIIEQNPTASVKELQAKYKCGLVWQAATLNKDLQKTLNVNIEQVWISEQTLIKQIKHRQGQPIGVSDYQLIDNIINHADEFVIENDLNAVFFRKYEKWYKVAMKTTRDMSELYVTSFHIIDEDHMRKKLK
ncbi:MAG: hypothetical protein KGV50_02555 [Gammaproteobacteria bacterium]|nr:hypothetical protein [Gammaproteobacteria bacterium]